MMGSGQIEQRRRLGALRAEEVRRLDAAAAAAGLPVEVLMETAGWQLARVAWRLLGRSPGRVLVCAGRGNNGGDALVTARQLATWGCEVSVCLVLADSEPSALVGEQRRRLGAEPGTAGGDGGVRVVELRRAGEVGALGETAARARLVIDGLLGSGLRGAPRALDATVIGALQHPCVLSVDLPSGMDLDAGTPPGACVRAHTTCTLTAMKQGLWTTPARDFTGRLLVADIGMPAAAWLGAELTAPTAVRGGALLRVPAAFH